MSIVELKDICDARSIKRIAIVDDVFDIPQPDHLNRKRYSDFRREYNKDKRLRQSVASVTDTEFQNLPDFDNLDEDDLEPLWNCVCKIRLGESNLKTDYLNILRTLFSGHSDEVLEMLDTVFDLFSLFRGDLGREVTVHGVGFNFDAGEIAKADIVVIDYFLEPNVTREEACKKVSQLVIDLVETARKEKHTIPSFLLVSSYPGKVEVEEFRKRTNLMKSRFRFFSKEALRTKCIEDMVNLHDLIDASDRTEKIEQLIKDWRKGATEAVSTIYEQMLELDVSDLVYLDCFRLTHEGTSIANYLRWFLTASLNAKVTGKLTKNLWNEAASLKLFSIVNDHGDVDQNTLAKTFDGPSDAIAQVYGDILFDETRGAGDYAFPTQLSGCDLVEGDLFVSPKNRDGKDYEDAEVRLVLTPSCDLLSRIPDQPPLAKSVLLLPGTLKKVKREDGKNNFAEDFFVRVPEYDEGQFFQVEWDFNNPVSVDWTKMCKKGPGEKFKRLGCVRNLYFHRVRDEFANHFTRIGTEVGPLLPHPRGGEVFIKVGKEFKPVMKFSFQDQFVWEIGPVRPNKKYFYQVSREFIGKLSEVLDSLPSKDTNLANSAKCSLKCLKNMRTYMDLLKPMMSDVRGQGGVVQIKKISKNSKPNLSSNANLLIVTLID